MEVNTMKWAMVGLFPASVARIEEGKIWMSWPGFSCELFRDRAV